MTAVAHDAVSIDDLLRRRTALPTEKPERARSLVLGRDGDVIPVLLDIHAPTRTPRILDCTYNVGVMWRGLSVQPTVTMDVDPSMPVDVVGDCTDTPFPDHSFDVVVFDPPHLPTRAASEHSSKMWEQRYGITPTKGVGRDGDNVSGMFLPFLAEARRVLALEGIVLAKIADIIHNHRYQWQHVDYINTARSMGLTPCDMIIKGDPQAGRLLSSKWQRVKHVRKAHCYWIVVRNSSRCECR